MDFRNRQPFRHVRRSAKLLHSAVGIFESIAGLIFLNGIPQHQSWGRGRTQKFIRSIRCGEGQDIHSRASAGENASRSILNHQAAGRGNAQLVGRF